jgi:outer membrane protein TolC
MPRLLCSLIISILPLSISGCADFQDRPLNPITSATHIDARTLSNPDLHNFITRIIGHKNKSWDMDSLTLAAIYYHADVAVAQALADNTDAAITTAGQRPNPSISLSPTWISNLASTAMPWIFASSLSIPIETANKRDLRIDKAEHSTEAARLRVADAVWQVRGRLRLALLEIYAASEAERLLQQQQHISQEITQRSTLQAAAGEISPDELNHAQLALNQVHINLATAQKRLAESRVLLATAIGITVAALTGVELDTRQFAQPPDLAQLPVARLRTTALHYRPDIVAALADYAAAQAALQLEIANQYPNIQANPAYTWEMGEHRWSLGGTTIQLPILHQNQGAIGEAEAKRAELATRFTALQLRIIGDIDKARAGLSAVAAKWTAAEQQRQYEHAHVQAVQALLQAGEADAVAVLTAELASAVAERTRLDTLVESQQAAALLEDALRYPIASTLSATTINNATLRKTHP